MPGTPDDCILYSMRDAVLFGGFENLRAVYHEIHEDDFTPDQYHRLLLSFRKSLIQFAIRPHSDWPLSNRAVKMLLKNNLTCLWDIRHLSVEEICKLKDCGVKAILEIYTEGKKSGWELDNWLLAIGAQYKNTFYPSRKADV